MPFPVKIKDQAFAALTLVQDDVKTMAQVPSHFSKIRLAERLAFIFFSDQNAFGETNAIGSFSIGSHDYRKRRKSNNLKEYVE